jgi:hypothetical protein
MRTRRPARRGPARMRRPGRRGPARMRRPGRRRPAWTTRRPARMRRPGRRRPARTRRPARRRPARTRRPGRRRPARTTRRPAQTRRPGRRRPGRMRRPGRRRPARMRRPGRRRPARTRPAAPSTTPTAPTIQAREANTPFRRGLHKHHRRDSPTPPQQPDMTSASNTLAACRTTTRNPRIPATKGPRFPGETEDAWRRRFAAADGLIDVDEQYLGRGPVSVAAKLTKARRRGRGRGGRWPLSSLIDPGDRRTAGPCDEGRESPVTGS